MKKEITSRNLKRVLHDIYHGLNLMSVLNLVLYLALAFLLIKTGIISKLYSGNFTLIVAGFIFLYFSINSQYKKLSYKNSLGQELDDDQWKRFNREMDNRSTKLYGEARNLTMVVLTKSFLFFPSKVRLEILPLEDITSNKKITVDTKGSKKANKDFIELRTKSGNHVISYQEELFRNLSLRAGR